MTEDGPPPHRRWPRRSAWATPSGMPPPPSKGSTPRPRRRSSPRRLPGSVADDVHARASPRHPADIAAAGGLGYVVKLLALVERSTTTAGVRGGRGPESAAVHRGHAARHPPLFGRGADNAVFVEGDNVDELMLYGRGAAGRPTALPVLGDPPRRRVPSPERPRPGRVLKPARRRLRPIDEVRSACCIAIRGGGPAGSAARRGRRLRRHRVSIRSMEQERGRADRRRQFVTHPARRGRCAPQLLHGLRGPDVVEHRRWRPPGRRRPGSGERPGMAQGLSRRPADLLPVTDATPVVTLLGGRHAAARSSAALRAVGARVLVELKA